jgi:3-oxoacyl-[acyl-carrier-protein] synthase II
MNRGVITGAGAVSSLGRGAGSFYRALVSGAAGIRAMTGEERRGVQAREVARIDGFSPQPEISAMKARRFDRGSQFALIASMQALESSGFPVESARERIGIALGTGSAGAGALTEFMRVLLTESPEAAPPFHFPNTVANAPASQASIELKIYGPNVTITQKDPSALNALIYASLCLCSGRADAMIAGGVDEWNPVYAAAFDRIGALRGVRRPSGIVQGEGAYVVLLEREERAKERGAKILARLSGFSFAGSPEAPYRFAADADAAERAIREALAAGEASPAQVDLLLPSRNGHQHLDRAEEEAIGRVFGQTPLRQICVKDSIGEMAAAGGAQVVAAALAISQGEARCALINSFGAGGNFICALLASPLP